MSVADSHPTENPATPDARVHDRNHLPKKSNDQHEQSPSSSPRGKTETALAKMLSDVQDMTLRLESKHFDRHLNHDFAIEMCLL